MTNEITPTISPQSRFKITDNEIIAACKAGGLWISPENILKMRRVLENFMATRNPSGITDSERVDFIQTTRSTVSLGQTPGNEEVTESVVSHRWVDIGTRRSLRSSIDQKIIDSY